MLGTLGLILVINGSVVAFRHAPTTRLSNVTSVPNCAPPFLDIGARDVEFERADALRPRPGAAPPRRIPRCVAPQMLMIVGTFSSLRNGQYFRDEPVDAGPLEPDGVEHPAGDFDRPRLTVARHGLEPDALDHHRAELVQVKELGVLDTVAERARGHRHRVLHPQLADGNR